MSTDPIVLTDKEALMICVNSRSHLQDQLAQITAQRDRLQVELALSIRDNQAIVDECEELRALLTPPVSATKQGEAR